MSHKIDLIVPLFLTIVGNLNASTDYLHKAIAINPEFAETLKELKTIPQLSEDKNQTNIE